MATLPSLVRVVGPFLLALLAAAPTVAQEPASADGPTVAAVEPFVVGDLAMGEVGPTSAVLPIVTEIDLACVVVYGEDEGFGRIALDAQMGAAAHRDHRIVLANLEPDTEYLYRLQGSAPDGRLFASRTYRFRTAEARSDARFGPPIEGLSVADVSSEFSDAFAAAYAIDGDGGSEWSSAGDGDDAFLTVDLGGRTQVAGIGVWTRTMARSARIDTFVVETDDGRTFGPFELPDADGLHRFEVGAETSTLTLRVRSSNGGNTGLVEFEVYGAP